MNDALLYYYIGSVITGVGGFLFALSLAAIVVGFFGTIALGGSHWNSRQLATRLWLPCVLVFVLTSGANALLPDKQFWYMLAGVEMGKEVAQTDLGKKAYQVIDGAFDKALKELKK